MWVETRDLHGLKDSFKFKFEQHSFTKKLKRTNLCYCKYCGLLQLRNDFSRWAVKMGCMNRWHPDHKRWLRTE